MDPLVCYKDLGCGTVHEYTHTHTHIYIYIYIHTQIYSVNNTNILQKQCYKSSLHMKDSSTE